MIFFVCLTPQCRSINRAPGLPSNDWLCGECGMRLLFYPIVHMQVNRGAPMKNAIYAPHGAPLSPGDEQHFDPDPQPSSVNNNNTTTTTTPPPQPQPMLTDSVVDFSKPLTPPELVELVTQPQKTLVTEAISQNELYQPLSDKGFMFLRRDGQFGKLKLTSNRMDAEGTVPEPTVTNKGFQKDPFMGCLVGRNEINMIYTAGSVTYPDFVVMKQHVVYFIELKTPREWTFKNYLSQHFYQEKVFGGRSIVDEINARQKLTPPHAENIFLFDIRNNTQVQQAIIDLGNSIIYAKHKEWWMQNIKGVMFFSSEHGLSKKFTLEEITAGQSITNTKQQTNLNSFFKKTTQ